MAPFRQTSCVPFEVSSVPGDRAFRGLLLTIQLQVVHPLSPEEISFHLLGVKQRSPAWRPVAGTAVMFQEISPHRLIIAHLFQLGTDQSLRVSGVLGGALRPVQSPENLVFHPSWKQIQSSCKRGALQQPTTATRGCGVTATGFIQQMTVSATKRWRPLLRPYYNSRSR